MDSIIPLNGRIAIIDDRPKEAYPLIRTLSHNNIPYVYIKGDDIESFPQQAENDIRILFLDINLVGGQAVSDKQVKSTLINTFSNVIASGNYPYILIYWSKQEKEYDEMLQKAFEEELKDRKPIAIRSLPKSDFFPDFDEEEHANNKNIIEEIRKIIQETPAYSYLMQWENIAHVSTDELLKNIFPNAKPEEWEKVTDVILNSLGRAYIGQYFAEATPEEKIKASLFALNSVYIDSLDNSLANCTIISPQELDERTLKEDVIDGLKANLNHKMLVFTKPNNMCEPGVVIEYKNPKSNYFEQFLHKIISVFFVKNGILREMPDILDSVLKEEINNRIKQVKKEIKQTWMKIGIVVTPSCDYAQRKKVYDRIVQGVMIESRYSNYINQGDAFYISPTIKFDSRNYIIILNYNYFVTSNLNEEGNCDVLFKLRRPVLAEIQSKLARHINRQGIMNL